MSQAGGFGRGRPIVAGGHTHADVTGGWLRPAVFGVMDGLVSNFALIAGVAGGVASAGDGKGTIVLAGLAGLAAGAFSMAVGEYASVASQSELALAELEVERRALARNPAAEQDGLAQRFISRGVETGLAHQMAGQLAQKPEQALSVHAREGFGVVPGDRRLRCWPLLPRSCPSRWGQSCRYFPTYWAQRRCFRRWWYPPSRCSPRVFSSPG